MIAARLWAAALLTLASPFPALALPVADVATEARFAPPLDAPMTYRVTTRRVNRSGALSSFTLVYALRWQAAGRGYRLDATLRGIESDARPELVRALTGLLQPVIGERIPYLVAADGRSVALADAGSLWNHVAAQTQDLGAGARSSEARELAARLAALPAADREALVTGDIVALVAAANDAIPAGAAGEDNAIRTVARVERTALDAQTPLRIDTKWSVDTVTGLVVREQRMSWLGGSDGEGGTLIEERIRALTMDDPS